MTSTLDIGGQGGNAFPFDTIGATVTGKILNLEEVQQTDMDTGEPASWPDGKPKMQYRVTLQTDLRDPNNPADDGQRAVYLRGSRKSESKSSLAAVLDAVKTVTGSTALAVGGTLTLAYVANGPQERRGFNPPKQYTASYQPPAVNLDPQPTPQQTLPPAWVAPPQPAVQQPAVQQPAVQQPATQWTPEQIAAMQAAGIDPATLKPAT